ncbi:esterase/lipase family protein [Ideonella paludis]|nr:GPI inositol-deacylase [Ideonella paludis]
MTRRRWPLRAADLRGAARLLTQATTRVTDVVEGMHARISPWPEHPATPGQTQGLTRLIYRSVRSVARFVGGGVEALLHLLPEGEAQAPNSPQRDALIAALNGVLGDHLQASQNPLATPMQWRMDGQTLPSEPALLQRTLRDKGCTSKVLVLVHGLCMHDGQWRHTGHDHGAALAQALGFTPVYLRYNTGLPIAHNGADLAQQLEALLAAWPHAVERLVLLGHSMGGLVLRSALHAGPPAQQRWVKACSDLICLGSPHHGAPLEKAGHGLDLLLAQTPYTAPLAQVGQWRSAGIMDLRHGTVLRPPAHLPLPTGLRCHAVAACLSGAPRAGKPARLAERLLGDGLVPLDSALGWHRRSAQRLAFEPERCLTVWNTGHLDLLHSAQVSQQMIQWLR